MGFFDFFKMTDINEGLKSFAEAKDAVLLDVRTPQEYAQGRIPRSKNVPLQELERVKKLVPGRETPLFVYCLSGGRSRQAVSMLRGMGYTQVINLGGINGYRGKVEA